MKGPTALTDITTGEVSLVKRGANRKRIAVTKGMGMDELIKTALEVEAEGEAGIKNDSAKVAFRAIKAAEGLTDEDKKRIADALGIEMKAPEGGADPEKDIEKIADPVLKAQVEQLFKARADEKAEREKLQKALADSEEKAAKRELFARVEKSYGNVPSKSEDIAAILFTLAKADPEAAKALETTLTAVESQIGQSKLYESMGSSKVAGDAQTELQSKAEEMRKAHPEMSIQQARVQVRKTDPALNARVRAEVK